jgi:hypothetical protein
MQSTLTTSYYLDGLTKDEWDELIVLKNAISYSPSTVHPAKMERFTQLFAKSLKGKGDPVFQ